MNPVRRWLWMTFVYDRMWQPAQIARALWVKTRGYPLPRWLIPPLQVRGVRDTDDWHVASSWWTPVGMLWEARRIHRAGGYVRFGSMPSHHSQQEER